MKEKVELIQNIDIFKGEYLKIINLHDDETITYVYIKAFYMHTIRLYLEANKNLRKFDELYYAYKMTLENLASANENLRQAQVGYREGVMTILRQTELLAREERRHILKLHTITNIFGLQAVDLVHTNQREILLTLLWWVDNTADRIAWFEAKELNL